MSTVSMSKDSDAVGTAGTRLGMHFWLRLAILAPLFVWVFQRIFWRAYGPFYGPDGAISTWGYGWSKSEWTHTLVIPLMSLYFVYLQWDRVKKTVVRPSFWGFGLFLAGLLLYWSGIYPIRNEVPMGVGMILGLAGLVWVFGGWRVLQVLWFPIFFMVFMIRVPDRVMERISYPLQDIAAKSAGVVINFVGPLFFDLESEIRGNTIYLLHEGRWLENPLNVAEACSGLRSLMMFVTLGVGYAFITNRPLWTRLLVVASTVPVAVIVNIGRVSVMGFLSPYKQELTEGDFHKFIGMLMLIPAGLIFMLIAWVLDQVFVDDAKPGRVKTGGAS